MRLRIGTSTHADVHGAVSAAARSALGGAKAPAVALVFTTYEYPAEAVALAAQHELGPIPWAGVVTPAILADRRVVPRGVAVGVIDS